MKIKKRKKLALLLLGAVMACSAGAITANKAVKASAEEETFVPRNLINEFMFGSWVSYYDLSIKSYAEQTEDMGAAGINFNWHPEAIGTDINHDGANFYDYDAIEKAYADNGMMYLYDATKSGSNGYNDPAFKEMAKHCVGYYVKDEPSASQFKATAELFDMCLKSDPERSPYVNLYPNYAGTTALGGTYAQHVQNFVDIVGAENLEYLSYDHYPFTASETVRNSYFSDMETIRKVGYNSGRLKTLGMPQSGWWAGMRKPNVDEMRWNVNTYVAYGFKAISYFCWASPKYTSVADGGEAMQDFVIDRDGTRTELYEPLAEQNWQIRQLGDLLMSIDCAHAYHSGSNVADGAEKLPKSFFIQPESKQDSYIISLFYNKDNTETYVMIMNNSTSESKRGKFSVSADSGVTSITEFKSTVSGDNLPNHKDLKNTLGKPSQTEISVESGVFETDFLPGEVKIYKLNGENISISEGVSTPELSHLSGTYYGAQQVKITVPQQNARIYYTLDGSFPSVNEFGEPQGSTLEYTSPLTIGRDGEWSYKALRAAVVKNGEYSQIAEADYIITDGSKNVSLNSKVSFYNKEFTQLIEVDNEKGENVKGDVVVDGYHDPYTEVFTKEKTNGWAVVDMGKSHVIDKLSVSFWANWEFSDVIVQVSEDFNSWTSVFNNDTDGSMQSVTGEVGTDGTYKDEMHSGNVIAFEPKSVRYIRVHNVGAGGGSLTGKSIWQEISAFSLFDTNTVPNTVDLLKTYGTLDSWNSLGGGSWKIENGKIAAAGVGGWDRALALTEKKFKNFIIEGTFSMTDVTAGLVGFELYKTSPNGVLNGNNGYIVFIENKGRVGAYDGVNGGAQEFGGTNIQATNFTPAQFTFRVTSANDLLSVMVNGETAYTVRNPRADMDAGYIAIHAGSIGITVENLWIKELTDADGLGALKFEDALYEQAEEVTAAVKLYDKKEEALAKLPETVKIKTVGNIELELRVKGWHSENYNRKVAGWYDFSAEFDLTGIENTVNVMNVSASAKVWVSAGFDGEALQNFIDLAESLERYDFTEESWSELMQKLNTAKEIMSDPFTVQNSVGVASFQLKDAIDALVNISHNKTLLASAIEKCDYKAEDYTRVSFDAYSRALDAAQEVNKSSIAKQGEINGAVLELNNAVKALVKLYSKSELQAVIDGAKVKENKTERLDYAIAQAEKLCENDEITEAQGEIAAKAIKDAVSAMEKTEPDKDGSGGSKSGCGCGGSAGGASILLSVFALAACALLMRRKRIN